MSSGQQRVIINNAERAESDDVNKQSDFIARQRNEIWRSLCQVDVTPGSPGVTNLAQTALDDYPLDGVVIDGLEAVVDTPGYVMITAGTLAGWVGQPGDPGRDSGWLVVPSPGLAELLPTMAILPNDGTVPRCDIIEARFNGVETVTTENRDVYNPATESFVPAVVTKTAQVDLQFRVRTGTPGVPPMGDYGWMPLAMAIVQPGLPLTMVDFYDIRPLLRDLQGRGRTIEAMHGNVGALISRGSNHSIQAISTSQTIPTTTVYGTSQAEFNGMRIEGYMMRNTPITAATQANWGSNAQGVGGDGYGITLGSDIFLRGSTAAIGPYDDTIVIAACFPRLALQHGTVPRCVRYTQAAVNNLTAEPARRRPQGINGIVQAFGKAQEAYDFQNGGNPYYAAALNSDGFLGCVGAALCFPIATIPVDDYGLVNSSVSGAIVGAHIIDGETYVANVPVYKTLLTGHINIETDAVYESDGLTIPNAAFRDPLSKAGDYIEIELSGLFFKIMADVGAGHGGIRVIVTEDFFGTPVPHVISQWFRSYASGHDLVYPVNAKIPLTLTRGGTLQIEIRLYNSSGGSVSTFWNWSELNNWGTYTRYR